MSETAKKPARLEPQSETLPEKAPQEGAELPFSPAEYNAVVRNAKILSIVLKESTFEMKDEYFTDPKSHKFSFGTECKETRYLKKRGIGLGHFICSVSVRHGRKKVLKVRVVYLIMYENLRDKNREAVLAFVELIGKFATYPYFRTHVSQLSWESGASLPVLPVFST